MPSTSSRKGVTLAELLITFFIIGLVMGALATLMRLYRQVSLHERAREASLSSAQALNQVRGEVWEAVEVQDPPPGSSGPNVTLLRIDPNLSDRLEGAYGPATAIRSGPGRRPGDPLPEPSVLSWDPFDPAYLAQVTYRVDQGNLVREVVDAGGGSSQQIVAENVVGLTAAWRPGNRSLTLTLRCRESQQVATYQLLVVVEP